MWPGSERGLLLRKLTDKDLTIFAVPEQSPYSIHYQSVTIDATGRLDELAVGSAEKTRRLPVSNGKHALHPPHTWC